MKNSMITVDKEVLKELRSLTHLSQAKLGEELCVSKKTISAWENGRQNIDCEDFRRLCVLAEKDPAEFIDLTEENTDNVLLNTLALTHNITELKEEVSMLRGELQRLSRYRTPSEDYISMEAQIKEVLSLLPADIIDKGVMPDYKLLSIWRYKQMYANEFQMLTSYYHDSGKEWDEVKFLNHEVEAYKLQYKIYAQAWEGFLNNIFDERIVCTDMAYQIWCARKLMEQLLAEATKLKPGAVDNHYSYETSELKLEKLIHTLELCTDPKTRDVLKNRSFDGKYEIGQYEIEGNDRCQQIWVHLSIPVRSFMGTIYSYNASNGYDNPDKTLGQMPNMALMKSLFVGWEEKGIETRQTEGIISVEEQPATKSVISKVALKVLEKLTPMEYEDGIQNKTEWSRQRYGIYIEDISDKGRKLLEWYKGLDDKILSKIKAEA